MEYFKGKKLLSRETTKVSKNSFIKYMVYDEWKMVIEESLRCGTESSSKIIKTIGVSNKEISNLESSVKSTLGDNVFFKIENSLKGNIGTENMWSEELTSERTICFKAPECGYLKVEQHQLKRTIKLATIKNRFLRKPLIKEYKIQELLNKFHDNSKQNIYDRSCNCKEPTEITNDGYLIGHTENVSFNIPYVYIKEGISINLGNKSVTLENWDLSDESIDIETDALSESLQFFINKDRVKIDISQKKPIKTYSIDTTQNQEIENLHIFVLMFFLDHKVVRRFLAFFLGKSTISGSSSVDTTDDKHKDD